MEAAHRGGSGAAGRVCRRSKHGGSGRGLKAEVTSLGRVRDTLNVAMKISNESKEKDTAFILLFGEPSAFNEAGASTKAAT